MPIINGTFTNWTTTCNGNQTAVNLSNSSNLSCIMHVLGVNLPWFWTAVLISLYIALFVIFQNDQGRRKFVVITIVPFVLSLIMAGYGLITATVVDSTFAILIGTLLFVYLTSG